MPRDAWRPVRALRVAPPGLAGEGHPRAVFGASLEQAEQFLVAASTVGYATKPVPLFYALSQAGRAIAAASIEDDTWDVTSHGLVVPPEQPLRARLDPFAQVPATLLYAQPQERDSFGVLARATGSAVFTGGVQVAELWASLPELSHSSELCLGHPRARELDRTSSRDAQLIRPRWRGEPSLGLAYGSPEEWRLSARITLSSFVRSIEEAQAVAEADLAPYPRAAGARVYAFSPDPVPKNPDPELRSSVILEWPADGPTTPTGGRVLKHVEVVSSLHGGRYYLIPAVGDAPLPLSPLIAWWALLFALSSIARYEPATWTRALDVDASPLGVPLEDALDLAEGRIAELVVQALSR